MCYGEYMKKRYNSLLNNKHAFKHGMIRTRFYNTWKAIKQRCLNKSSIIYKKYGTRGIKVCKRWLKFENFRDDMYVSYLDHVKQFGENNTSIDRINNDGNYEIKNCRWATRVEQQNNRSNNHLITHKDKILNLTQWSEKLKINLWVLKARIYHLNWPTEKALTMPIRHQKK